MFLTAVPFFQNIFKIVLSLDGTSLTVDSGAGTDTHTHNSETSAGPDTYLFVTWYTGNETLVSATWDGSGMTILEQTLNSGSFNVGAAILYISGAQSGNVVLTFSDNVGASSLTIASATNVITPGTAVDADEDSTADGTSDLDNLTTPGAGGIRMAILVNEAEGSAVDWNGTATELSDFSDGTQTRHSVAYIVGDTGATIDPVASGEDDAMVGVSIR